MKRVAARFVLVLLSVSVTVGALECALRVFGMMAALPPDPMQQIDRSMYHFHAAMERLHPWAKEQTNAVRVAVIGDSFTLGGGVQLDDAYPSRLERLLNLCADATPVDVRIFGASGSSTYQQLDYLDQALLWKPSVVVLGICMNDPEDWTHRDELRRWRRDMQFQPPRGWLKNVTDHSYALRFVYVTLEHARANRGYRAYYRRLYNPDYSGWHLFVDSIAAFQNRCNASGCRLIALVFPLLSEPFDKGRYPFEPMHRNILDVLAANEIHYVDLLGQMRGKDPVRMQAVPNLDPHPSEIAHRIAAETLFSALLEDHTFNEHYVPIADQRAYLNWKNKAVRNAERERVRK